MNNFNYPNYNGYPQYPQGYQSNMQRQGQMYNSPMAQPQPMPMQQPMQYDMPISYIGYTNLKEAEAHILFPNQKAIFIDKANDMVYEKVCGGNGQSSITYYKKYEPQVENKPIETQKQEQPIDLSNFVKKDDLGEFVSVKQYNDLLARFEQLQKQVMGVRQNVGVKQQ
jgi:hypothetical protein